MGVFNSIKSVFVNNDAEIIDGYDENAIRDWLVKRLATNLKLDETSIDPSKPFEEYGLDSIFAVKVTGELEKVVEMRLSPALLFENTCVNDVAKVISESYKTN